MAIKLETERLILREPKMSDWKDLVQGLNNISVARGLGGSKFPYKKKDAEKWIKSAIKNWNKTPIEKYSFIIELKSEKKVIGCIVLFDIELFDKTAVSGSHINKKYQKKGYILESKIAVNEFAFNKLKLRKLKADAIISNVPSNNMMKRLGYKKEGLLRKEIKSKATNKIYDNNLYGLLKSEWKNNLPKLKKRLKEKIKKLK